MHNGEFGADALELAEEGILAIYAVTLPYAVEGEEDEVNKATFTKDIYL